MEKLNALVLFSGGKDSFLAACRMVMAGFSVQLLSINNGCVCGEDAFSHGGRRLQSRWGRENCKFIGVYNTAATIQRLTGFWADSTYEEIVSRYPLLINSQLNCLHCQTAMWIAAIAYCSVKGISVAACGYKRTDEFCTGLDSYRERIEKLGRDNGVAISVPVWAIDQDERDREHMMASFGFLPNVYEASCQMGRPAKHMHKTVSDCLMQYFDDQIAPLMQECVAKLEPIFRVIELSDTSICTMRYTDTGHSDGWY